MKTREIAEFVGGELVGDTDIDVSSVAAVSVASRGQLSFVERADPGVNSGASCLLVPRGYTGKATHIKVDNPKLAFAQVSHKLLPPRPFTDGRSHALIASTADVRTDLIGAFVTVGEDSFLAEECVLADGVRVGRGVKIGTSTVVHANAVIYDGVEIGKNCVIHSGCVIGADGFGYVKDETGNYVQFPQVGTLVIEDNVEIGANTCIDRGSLGETRIGEGTKIDNLVQIAHNVQIGKRVIIAAQTGISGSTIIEDDCVIGGQVGMGDHATVKSGAIIGSQAGVLPGKIVRPGVWWGTPVQPLDEYKRQNAHLKGLARLKDEVAALKKAVLDRD